MLHKYLWNGVMRHRILLTIIVLIWIMNNCLGYCYNLVRITSISIICWIPIIYHHPLYTSTHFCKLPTHLGIPLTNTWWPPVTLFFQHSFHSSHPQSFREEWTNLQSRAVFSYTVIGPHIYCQNTYFWTYGIYFSCYQFMSVPRTKVKTIQTIASIFAHHHIIHMAQFECMKYLYWIYGKI